MSDRTTLWQRTTRETPPSDFVRALRQYTPTGAERLAVLLWNRDLRDLKMLRGFLEPLHYQPASPFEFGEEMRRALERLKLARDRAEKVAIWGDFDADGVTATSVLWDGLGQFFERSQQLSYTIPNRFTDSHGLNARGIERLAARGVALIVTCDTGSTNLEEIHLANQLGLDIIVTDHHTLLDTRPPVTALINPRNLPTTHPLHHLSGVAVAYKLVEALYAELPEVPQQPLDALLDLVAIGLIADLVELRGDCRYLAQKGLERLQTQLEQPTRPGVAELLKRCKRNGDRPTDVSFGVGPRINAVSRIHGDASFCVELLTSCDENRCRELASEAELANTRRKELQQRIALSVRDKLAQLDLSTTSVIVLSDPQWDVGVLGLVAGEIASEYGRPTVLLREDIQGEMPLARGSARSVDRIDLYHLVKSQAHLLHRFGGHPFAAGLSLPLENLPLFTEAIDRELVEQLGRSGGVEVVVPFDLDVTVAELGKDLFRELKQIEPCGMGNPVPRLRLQNCWFEDVKHRNIQAKGQKIRYIRTFFKVCDATSEAGFPGSWWGHYAEELPKGRCDAIVELDFNTYDRQYEVRLIDVRPAEIQSVVRLPHHRPFHLLDWRVKTEIPNPHPPLLETCPESWVTLQRWFAGVRSHSQADEAALAYGEPQQPDAEEIWLQLVGVAKYLGRTGKWVSRGSIQEKLQIGDRPLEVGFERLRWLGFQVRWQGSQLQVTVCESVESEMAFWAIAQPFLEAVNEEQFRRRYFLKAPVRTLEETIISSLQ